jgi:hypothetical protein
MKVFEKKIICVDIDGIICKTKGNNYIKSKPIKRNREQINSLYKKGHIIKIFTARFMGRNNENKKMAEKDGYKLTRFQLKKWKLNYHELIMGKPSYDFFIDDKTTNNFIDLIKKLNK